MEAVVQPVSVNGSAHEGAAPAPAAPLRVAASA
jgi:hypothetical protein